ncbi:hypothetical protein SeLEV6574_g05237 [Synchytrium endobioticum]|uniref:Uncharacterized protein n=1 Tax=Synchytrium endobioticum TaxID=286115 RepID=A0A507CVC1_9FUNG|nr:hypothetical protein SeLEV6574_g05237 [Synchytrium endobioticum]
MESGKRKSCTSSTSTSSPAADDMAQTNKKRKTSSLAELKNDVYCLSNLQFQCKSRNDRNEELLVLPYPLAPVVQPLPSAPNLKFLYRIQLSPLTNSRTQTPLLVQSSSSSKSVSSASSSSVVYSRTAPRASPFAIVNASTSDTPRNPFSLLDSLSNPGDRSGVAAVVKDEDEESISMKEPFAIFRKTTTPVISTLSSMVFSGSVLPFTVKSLPPPSFERSYSCPAGSLTATVNDSPNDTDGQAAAEIVLQERQQNENTSSSQKDDGDNATSESRILEFLKQPPKLDAMIRDFGLFESLLQDLSSSAAKSSVPSTKSLASSYMFGSSLPQDRTLKKSVAFLSREPFDWCCAKSSIEESLNLSTFVQGSYQRDDPKVIFDHCLYYWAFIERPPPIQVALITKVLPKEDRQSHLKDEELAGLKHFQACEEQWKQAFRSVYHSVRNNLTDEFYYMNDDFAAVFSAGRSTTSGECEVIISNSTQGLRRALQREGIAFDMCPRKKRMADNVQVIEEDVEQELAEFGQEQPGRIVVMNGKDARTEYTSLHFKGHASVHSLFDYLLNWRDPRAHRRASQLPILLSLKPFLHATLKTLEILKNGKLLNNEVDPMTGLAKIETMYKLELAGYILPRVVSALTSLMVTNTGSNGFLARMSCEEGTLGLNETLATVDESWVSSSQDHKLPAFASIGFKDGNFAWR